MENTEKEVLKSLITSFENSISSPSSEPWEEHGKRMLATIRCNILILKSLVKDTPTSESTSEMNKRLLDINEKLVNKMIGITSNNNNEN